MEFNSLAIINRLYRISSSALRLRCLVFDLPSELVWIQGRISAGMKTNLNGETPKISRCKTAMAMVIVDGVAKGWIKRVIGHDTKKATEDNRQWWQ